MEVTLYYRDDRSDKVYHAAIETSGDGFLVNFSYGRRGGPQTAGTKTPNPVSYASAVKIYEKLVAEKTAKGYAPGAAATKMISCDGPVDVPFRAPQLCNEVDVAEVPVLISDPSWMAQPKHDGIRLQLHRDGDHVFGFSRQGKRRDALPEPVVKSALEHIWEKFVMDGELVGDVYHAFEMQEIQGDDVRNDPAMARLMHLGRQGEWGEGIRIVETACNEDAKVSLLQRLKDERAEGVVFKRYMAPYTPGRPNSGGDFLKYKFTATGSFLVAAHKKGKRSVELELFDQTPVGACTIPANHEIPAVGRIVEIRYLYFVGSLVQPQYQGIREDIYPSECTAAQLKYRQGAGEDDDV